MKNCQNCPLCSTRKNIVFGDGNPHAEIMFIGEGPGESEDEQGLPFVGRAGELLTRMIGAMGFDRWKDVYIANIVKCRPPGNRNPDEKEAKACLPYLERQIELIKPKVLVLLGAVPLLHLLNMRGIMRLHGNWFEYKGIKTLPTFHPAFLLRNPPMKAEAWKDLQVVMREFGKTPPRKQANG
ncbi:MAG: uracil-DNA glycosylase [Lentisphaeria bacterium]|nr:uracil-DNA glycosylase [Lentisphaeria bacterium]